MLLNKIETDVSQRPFLVIPKIVKTDRVSFLKLKGEIVRVNFPSYLTLNDFNDDQIN